MVTTADLTMMEGFHVHAARRMAGMMPRKTGDIWKYPKSRWVLAAMGLRPLEHYIMVRRHNIAQWITHRPIFELCKDAGRWRGLAPRPFWWDQCLDLLAEV